MKNVLTSIKKFSIQLFCGNDGATPLPKAICISIFFLVLFHAMVVNGAFSYLPQLVKEFGASQLETGRKVGMLASTIYICMIFSSVVWGYICDKKGRKFSIYLCCCGLIVTTTLFAFTSNYTWAITTRCFQGFFMGLVVIGKVVLSEISDDTNLAAAITLLYASFNLGLILGPSISGFLVFPVDKYPKVFSKGGFFDSYKIFLPNFLFVVGVTLSMIASTLLIPKDTKKDKSPKVNIEKAINDSLILSKDMDIYLNYSLNLSYLNSKEKETSKLIETQPTKASFSTLKNSSLGKLFRCPNFLVVLTSYFLFSVAWVGYEELLPVHAATDPIYHGYGITSSDIGMLYLIASLMVVVMQFTVLKYLVCRFGSKKVFCGAALCFSLAVVLIPTVGLVKNRPAFWILVCVDQILIRAMLMAGFLAINIILNNSVDPSLLGAANGLGVAMTASGRMIGPIFYGNAHTWALERIASAHSNKKEVFFPLNEYFPFILTAITMLSAFLLSTRIPISFNKKKVVTNEKNNFLTVTTSYVKFENP